LSSLTEIPGRIVYKGYCGRGECENRIKVGGRVIVTAQQI